MTELRAARANAAPPRMRLGFNHITRYWDDQHGMFAAKLLPGEYYVTREQETIVTVLGSCVSACVRDTVMGIGGMNHFMLPLGGSGGSWGSDGAGRAPRGGHATREQMINDILKNGGHR